ncbi:MAG: ABC transporter permease [Phycisphaerales bacterium]
MALTDFTIINRSLRVRLFSTVTTVLMVGVSVAMLLSLLAMRDAGRRTFERGPGNMHVLVSADSGALPSVLNAIFYARSPARPLTWARYQQLFGSERDMAAGPPLPIDWAIPTQQGDSYAGWPTMATTPEFFSRFQPDPEGERDPERRWQLADGRFFEKPFEVVLGAKAAAGTRLKVGDRLYLTHGTSASRGGAGEPEPAGEDEHDHAHDEEAGHDDHADHDDHAHDEEGHDHGHDDHVHADEHAGHVHREFPFTVVGVLRATGTAHDRAIFSDLASSWILHAHDRRERDDPGVTTTSEADLIESDKLITGVYVRVKGRPGSDASAAIGPVFDALRRQPDLTVANPAEQVRQLFVIVSNIDQIFVAMAAVVLVSSAIAIMLALYNSMEQRRRQIAVLRVLGASRGRIFGLVLTESAVVGALGAISGVALCLLGVRLVAAVLKERLGILLDAGLPFDLALSVGVGTVLLAAIAGIIPAVSAYRTSVARNLRPIG